MLGLIIELQGCSVKTESITTREKKDKDKASAQCSLFKRRGLDIYDWNFDMPIEFKGILYL